PRPRRARGARLPRRPGGAARRARGAARAAAHRAAPGARRVRPVKVAQISDIHCGSPHFVPTLLDRAIVEINELEPDLVVVSGDLTNEGFRGEYQMARDYLD